MEQHIVNKQLTSFANDRDKVNLETSFFSSSPIP